MRRSWALATLAATCALALGGCSKEVDSSAAAPGRPAPGSTAEVVQPAPPGAGLNGGLGEAPVAGASAPGAAMGAAPAAALEGSANTTTKSSVGNR